VRSALFYNQHIRLLVLYDIPPDPRVRSLMCLITAVGGGGGGAGGGGSRARVTPEICLLNIDTMGDVGRLLTL
jgi:hypothetical protein